MHFEMKPEDLKNKVKDYWEAEVCGTRFVQENKNEEYYQQIERTRYEAEYYIPDFARFKESSGKRVLEIGVGAGTDFIQWIRAGAYPVGIDLTEAAISATKKRLEQEQIPSSCYELHQKDAENLPFADNSFDIVYSHGVLHHTPNTSQALK